MKYLKTYENLKPVISYYRNGQKRREEHFLNGFCHREDGPSNQYWYDNGQKSTESYYINDERHREDGPAIQEWHRNGQKKYETYYLNDRRYSREYWLNKLKEIGSPHYQEQLFKYEADQYNL